MNLCYEHYKQAKSVAQNVSFSDAVVENRWWHKFKFHFYLQTSEVRFMWKWKFKGASLHSFGDNFANENEAETERGVCTVTKVFPGNASFCLCGQKQLKLLIYRDLCIWPQMSRLFRPGWICHYSILIIKLHRLIRKVQTSQRQLIAFCGHSLAFPCVTPVYYSTDQ